MPEVKSNPKVKSFVIKNWYKLAILGFFCYLFLQKDLSFQINLNAPFQNEEVPSEKSPSETEQQPFHKPVKKQLEKITQNEDPPKVATIPEQPMNKLGFDFGQTETPNEDNFLNLAKIDDGKKVKFLKRFAHVAINERKKFGIPSSIILANALLHSQAGKSVKVSRGNNYFGVPCTGDWSGATENFGSCFRAYKNAWASFRDHSNYITSNQFSDLRNLGSQNYKAWAAALAQKKYSNEPNLEKKLLELIKEFQLYELDLK